MEKSIAFSPNVPDRALDKEVGKIDDRLGDVDDTIRPNIEPQGGGLDGIGGVGGRGGGVGGGMAAAGGAAGLASKLPSPVSGVAMSSALPVALGGAVGVGLLSQMTKASGRLQTTVSLFGTAMNLFFRPFGNFLGNTLRPFAKSGVKMARRFNDVYRSEGLAVAVGTISADALGALGGAVGNAVGDAFPGGDKFGAGDALTLGITGLTAAKLAGLLPSIGIGGILTGMGSSTLSGLLPSLGIGSVLTSLGGGSAAAGGGALVALLGGVISLGDLVDGDISSWNLPAKFGHALGQGFKSSWPGMAKKIKNFFQNNIFAKLGEQTREFMNPESSNDTDPGGVSENTPGVGSGTAGTVRPDSQIPDSVGGGSSGNSGGLIPDNVPFLGQYQTGGRVNKSGIAEVHRGEMIADPERLVDELSTAITAAGGGGGGGDVDMSGLRDDLGDVKRLLRQLVNSDTTLEVDGEELARTTTSKKQNRIADRNNLV